MPSEAVWPERASPIGIVGFSPDQPISHATIDLPGSPVNNPPIMSATRRRPSLALRADHRVRAAECRAVDSLGWRHTALSLILLALSLLLLGYSPGMT